MKTCDYHTTANMAKVTSSGNKMTVKFKSDSGLNKKGFRATWEMVKGKY